MPTPERSYSRGVTAAPPPGHEEAVAALLEAGTVSFGPAGFAAALSPALVAMRTLAAVGARGHAEWVLDHAGPSGRVYAATLLGLLDVDAGRAAWQGLSTDGAEFTQLFGCMGVLRTVGEYAREQLAR